MISSELHTAFWRRFDAPGHDAVRLVRHAGGWHLAGSAVLLHGGAPASLSYTVDCDAAWRTRSGTVTGWVGGRDVALALEVDAAQRWFLNGVECPAVAGCVDVDYGFTPATNLLPVRRLELALGAEAPVRAAWLQFPELTLAPLEQVYRRTGGRCYRYESGGGAFAADLDVDAVGLVTRYGHFWAAEPV